MNELISNAAKYEKVTRQELIIDVLPKIECKNCLVVDFANIPLLENIPRIYIGYIGDITPLMRYIIHNVPLITLQDDNTIVTINDRILSIPIYKGYLKKLGQPFLNNPVHFIIQNVYDKIILTIKQLIEALIKNRYCGSNVPDGIMNKIDELFNKIPIEQSGLFKQMFDYILSDEEIDEMALAHDIYIENLPTLKDGLPDS